MRVLCIGCSWSEGYPAYLTAGFVTKHNFNGKGLWYIVNQLENDEKAERYNKIILQLPTPIRYRIDIPDTRRSIEEFKRSMMSERQVIDSYKKEIVKIINKYNSIIILLYETGGYPFRHPYDFGENVRREMIEFIGETRSIHVDFNNEENHTKSYNDMHPSSLADKKCAEIISKNI